MSYSNRIELGGGLAFIAGLRALTRSHVDFVLVGVGGINFYAADQAGIVATLDIDVLLPPDTSALRGALSALHVVGFTFEAGGEPFVDLDDEVVLASIVRSGASVAARDPEGAQLDLMLSLSGFRYEDLAVAPPGSAG